MKYFLTLGEIYFTIQTNVAVHFLSRLPFVNKIVQPSWHSRYQLKRIVAWLGVLFDLIKQTLANNISILFFIYLIPNLMLPENARTSGVYIASFVLLKCVSSPIFECKLFRSQADDYTYLNHFMVEPAQYYRYKAVKNAFYEGIMVFPVLLYILRDVLTVFALVSLKVASIFLCNVFYLNFYKRKTRAPKLRIRQAIGFFVVCISYFCLYWQLYQHLSISCSLACSLIAASAILTAACWKYHCDFTDYKSIAVQFVDKSVITFQVSVSSSVGEDVNGIRDTPWEENKAFLQANYDLSLPEYLEKVFAHRYGKALWRSNRTQAGVFLGIFFLLGLAVRFHWLSVSASNVLSYSPMLITFVASLSFAGRLSQMYFRCIDMHILYHHLCSKEFLRTAIIKRWFHSLKFDFMHSLTIVCGILGFLIVSNISLPFLVVLQLITVCVLILILWETYEWIIYYLVQPYSVELTVKSPIFKILGCAESIFNLLALFVRSNLSTALPFVLCLTICSVGILFLCYIWAPRTFKLRL